MATILNLTCHLFIFQNVSYKLEKDTLTGLVAVAVASECLLLNCC